MKSQKREASEWWRQKILKISIFISRKKDGEITLGFVAELSEIEVKHEIMENVYAMYQIKVVLNFKRSLLRLAN